MDEVKPVIGYVSRHVGFIFPNEENKIITQNLFITN